jgi:putative ABC transport system permease protein
MRHYLKSAWRTLLRHKGYSILNITGLAIAMAVCVLIALFIDNELSYDKLVPDRENLYRINEYIHYNGTTPQLGAATGLPVAPLLKADYSQVEDYARVFPAMPYIYPSITLEFQGKKVYAEHMLCCDSSFGRMFGIRSVESSTTAFMPLRNNIVLTQSIARKLFGVTSAVNKILTLRVDDSTSYPMAVSNVIPDFSPRFHIQGDGCIPFPDDYQKGVLRDNYSVLLGPSYLRLRPGSDIASLEKQFTKTIHQKNVGIDVRMQRLSEIHTGSIDFNYDYLNAGKIDGKYLRVFVIIALAIFFIACSNFVNLTLVITAYRGKEVAVKKILGAARGRIVAQIFTDSLFSVVIAMLLSIGIACLCLPILNTIVGRQLKVSSFYRGFTPWLFVGMVVFTTLIASAYPAFLIASARIDDALRSKHSIWSIFDRGIIRLTFASD